MENKINLIKQKHDLIRELDQTKDPRYIKNIQYTIDYLERRIREDTQEKINSHQGRVAQLNSKHEETMI